MEGAPGDRGSQNNLYVGTTGILYPMLYLFVNPRMKIRSIAHFHAVLTTWYALKMRKSLYFGAAS